MKNIALLGIALLALSSCTQKHTYTVSKEVKAAPLPVLASKPVSAYPDATAFRMSGDYGQNVAITLSPNGDILYFPAPSDITADSEPIALADGWWLNCQGLGANSVFTTYTFAEYASLPQAPSPQQLKNAIIPGAKVTQIIQLPMKLNEAVNNLDAVNQYLKQQ